MKHIYWHLIPIVGLIAIWTHSEQFDVNNPFHDKFDNSDPSKDPYLFFVLHVLYAVFLIGIITPFL